MPLELMPTSPPADPFPVTLMLTLVSPTFLMIKPADRVPNSPTPRLG